MAKAKEATTAIVKVGPADYELATKRLNPLVKRAEEFVIRTQTDYDAAGLGMKKADEFLDSEDVRKFVDHAKTLNDLKTQAVSWRDALIKPAKRVKEILGQKRVAYQERIEREASRKREEEQEKLRQKQIEEAKAEAAKIRRRDPEAARAIVETAKAAPAPELPTRKVEAGEGFAMRTFYEYEIEDVEKIPIKYYVLDESLIRKDVNAFGMNANIPGVRVWEKKKQYTV